MFETIKTLRLQKGFSQSYLASYLGVSRQMYIKYENGEVDPSVKSISLLSKLYSVPYDVLIDNKLGFKPESVLYSINHKPQETLMVAEPSYSYKPAQNPILESIINQIKTMPKEMLISVSAYCKLLKTEAALMEKKQKESKTDFFNLCGKINLDENDIQTFREESKI